ncbi:MAG: inositol monophosphatase [Clostridia bacterium]|nr:inositol monophosphatase [Clostridia bacterium]
MEDLNIYLDFAKDIAKEAGDIMKKYFKRDDISTYKGDRTIVTLADKEINSYLIKRVQEEFPDHCVDGEEERYGDSKYVWICDPVDGTAMYARKVPVAVFSLALVVDGKPLVGVIYDVFTDNMYTAIKGNGAYQNDKKINVNDYELEDIKSVSNFDVWAAAEYDIFPVLEELCKESYFVAIGSVIRACTCVASGEFVCAIFPGTINKYFDIAAAKVIVEEAGGVVTDLFGNEQRYDENINGALISNKVVHKKLVDTINKYIENKK